MLQAFFDFRSILLFSGLICTLLALQTHVQSRIFTQFGRAMRLLSISMALGAISLIGAALTYDDPSWVRTVAANVPGILAYYLAVMCAINLYQPNAKSTVPNGVLILAAGGTLLLQQGVYMDVWATTMQGTFTWLGLHAVFRGKEPHAPFARRVLIAAMAPLLTAALLHNYVMLKLAAVEGAHSWNGHYDASPLMVIAWAFAPFAFSSAIFTIINARIAGRLKELADFDALTGLKVRRRFFEESRSIVARRNESAGELAVMMIDIDHFKSINDRFGHSAGDVALQHVASLIAATTRPDTLVSRFGGEEFCVLARIEHRDEGHAIAERIRAKIASAPMKLDSELVHLSVSIGIAFHDAHTTLETLLDKADRHLYAAKRGGRNRVMGFDIGPEMAPVV